MSTHEGVVKKIHTKTGTGKKGPWTLYRVLIDDEWYGAGFDKPKFEEGQTVMVKYEEGQYGREIKRSKVTNAEKQTTGTGPSAVKGAGYEKGMAWGNASNVAATLISKMADIEALPLTAVGSKTTKAVRFNEFMELYNKLRVQLYNDALDVDRVLAKVADAGAVEEEEPTPLPNDPELSGEDFDDEPEWDD